MGKIGKESCLHGIHGLGTILPENRFLHRRRAAVGLVLFIADEVLSQQQILDPLILKHRDQLRE